MLLLLLFCMLRWYFRLFLKYLRWLFRFLFQMWLIYTQLFLMVILSTALNLINFLFLKYWRLLLLLQLFYYGFFFLWKILWCLLLQGTFRLILNINILCNSCDFLFLFLCFLLLLGFVLSSDIVLSLFSIGSFLVTYFKFCLIFSSLRIFKFARCMLIVI